MPPPNVPLWNREYFELEATENQQMQEKFSALPLVCLKAEHKFPSVKVASISPLFSIGMRRATLSLEMDSRHQDEYV